VVGLDMCFRFDQKRKIIVNINNEVKDVMLLPQKKAD
jgi:hypothetical protein